MYINAHIWNLENGINKPICKEGMKTQMQRIDLWIQWGKERGGQMEKVALTYIHCCYCCC